jgi:hypothetical protein
VVPIAVDFDNQSLLRPKEVDEPALNEHIHLGRRQIRLPAQGKKVDLWIGSGFDSTWVDLVAQASELSSAFSTDPFLDHLAQLSPMDVACSIGSYQSALHLAGIKACGEIEQGPLRRGNRNPRLNGDVLGRKRASLMQSNTVGPAMAGAASHLNWAERSADIPKLRCASIGEHCTGTAGKDGREPFAAPHDASMPQREDPSVKGDQLPSRYPIFDLPPTKTHLDQLPPGNDAVLRFGQTPNRRRRLPSWCNALSAEWTDNTLHREYARVVLLWCNDFSVGWMDKTLHRGWVAGVVRRHGPTVAAAGARGTREWSRFARR